MKPYQLEERRSLCETEWSSVPVSIYELQISVTLFVLLQTTKSQNMGHAQHVSFYLSCYGLIQIPVCVLFCMCVFFIVCATVSHSLSHFVHYTFCFMSDLCNQYNWSFKFDSGFFHIPSCMNRWFWDCFWCDSIFSVHFPTRGLNQSGYTLARILAKYWPLCWQSTLPHKVRVLQFLSVPLSPILGW